MPEAGLQGQPWRAANGSARMGRPARVTSRQAGGDLGTATTAMSHSIETEGTASLWRSPTLWVLFVTLLWGLYWIPIMYLEARGFTGVWAGLLMNIGALTAATALLLYRPPSRSKLLSGRVVMGGLLFGLAVTLYATSILTTDVARAVLLFYISPAWSTLIEMVFMGRRAGPRRFAALGFSAAGLLVLTRGEIDFSDAAGLGDAMALASGLAWAVGSALLFGRKEVDLRAGCFHSLFWAVLTGLILASLLPSEARAPLADWASGLGMGAAYILPIVLICFWGALKLPPGKLGFLLTGEIVSGLLSAALLLDQPFGWGEIGGALLICAAAASEALARDKPRPKG